MTQNERRFDSESVRRILERAAAEQYRLDNELADTYSLEELEEMAAKAGISHDALRAAVQESARGPGDAIARDATGSREGPRSLVSLRIGNWSATARAAAVTGAVAVVLFGALLAFPVAAQVLFWMTIVLFLLVLLGAFSF